MTESTLPCLPSSLPVYQHEPGLLDHLACCHLSHCSRLCKHSSYVWRPADLRGRRRMPSRQGAAARPAPAACQATPWPPACSTRCSPKWMASPAAAAYSCWAPPTGPRHWTPRSCALGAWTRCLRCIPTAYVGSLQSPAYRTSLICCLPIAGPGIVAACPHVSAAERCTSDASTAVY